MSKTTQLVNRLISEIVEIDASTFDSLLTGLRQVFHGTESPHLAILSRSITNPETWEIISSTATSHRQPDVDLNFKKRLLKMSTPIGDIHLYLAHQLHDAFLNHPMIVQCIESKLAEVSNHFAWAMQRLIVEASLVSKDVNSLAFRTVRILQENFIKADEISVFLYDRQLRTVTLSATTAPVRGIHKKDIYYAIQDEVPTVIAFKTQKPVVQDDSVLREDFDGNLLVGASWCRGIWPITTATLGHPSKHQLSAPSLGVLRLTNLRRQYGPHLVKSTFTEMDNLLVTLICEQMSTSFHQFSKFVDADANFARLTHGILANIDASRKFASMLRHELFTDSAQSQSDQLAFSEANQELEVQTRLRIYHLATDLEYFLEDLNFQFDRIKPRDDTLQLQVIKSLHTEVLMPAVRLSEAIAAVNSKRPPKITNLRDRGSLDLPQVVGNAKAYIQVFRNLIENSIKYTKTSRAHIQLDFTNRDDGYVVIDFADEGIGVLNHEAEQIFMEGYRSIAARRVSNRGTGLGLSFSRDILRSFGGELRCVPSQNGAHFEILIRKAS